MSGSFPVTGVERAMRLEVEVTRSDLYGNITCDECGLFADPELYTAEELGNPDILVLCDQCIREDIAEQEGEWLREHLEDMKADYVADPVERDELRFL